MTKAVATSAVQRDFGECMNVRASRVSDAAAKFAVWCRGDVRLISAPNARDRRSKVQWPKSKVCIARQALDIDAGDSSLKYQSLFGQTDLGLWTWTLDKIS